MHIHLILHGALILFIANLFGFPLGRALASRRASTEKREAWRMAHSANTGFGVFLLATAAIYSDLSLNLAQSNILAYSLIASGYGFLLGTLIAAITGYRGLKIKGPLINQAVFGCYVVGVLGSLVGVPMIILGALQGL